MSMSVILTVSCLLAAYCLMANLLIAAVWLFMKWRGKPWKQRYGLYLFMAVLPVYLTLFALLGLKINLTPSIPIGIYRAVKTDGIALNDIAEYCLDYGAYVSIAKTRDYLRHGPCPSGLQPLVKVVKGLPGNVLAINEQGQITVDGEELRFSEIAGHDSQNRPLPCSGLVLGEIPAGKAFLISYHQGGFDSRYFGLAEIEKLKKVRPLITF